MCYVSKVTITYGKQFQYKMITWDDKVRLNVASERQRNDT